MKIAIPTMDGTSISQHFGHCKAFLVYDVEGIAIRSKETRENSGGCGGHHGAESTGHGGFVRLLGDCQAVIAKGIGGGALQALKQAGLQVHTVAEAIAPEAAAIQLATGSLLTGQGSTCDCNHH